MVCFPVTADSNSSETERATKKLLNEIQAVCKVADDNKKSTIKDKACLRKQLSAEKLFSRENRIFVVGKRNSKSFLF